MHDSDSPGNRHGVAQTDAMMSVGTIHMADGTAHFTAGSMQAHMASHEPWHHRHMQHDRHNETSSFTVLT